jgi:hypothetical protein
MEAGRDEFAELKVSRSFMGYRSVLTDSLAVQPALRAPFHGYGLDDNVAGEQEISYPLSALSRR